MGWHNDKKIGIVCKESPVLFRILLTSIPNASRERMNVSARASPVVSLPPPPLTYGGDIPAADNHKFRLVVEKEGGQM